MLVNDSIVCEYKGSVTKTQPISHRRYTFLENDNFRKLVVALKYDSRNTDVNGNQLLGEWAISHDRYVLYFHINIKKDESTQSIAVQDSILRESLALKIKNILIAEKELLEKNKILCNSRVIVYFKSSLPYYDSVESWGFVRDYLYKNDLSLFKHHRKESDIIRLLLNPYIKEKLNKFEDDNDKDNDNDEYFLDIVSLKGDEFSHDYRGEFILRVNSSKKSYKFSANFNENCINVSEFKIIDSKILF